MENITNYIFNFLLLIFNGLLALFTYLLWRTSRQQADILRRSVDIAKESADASRVSADAAKLSAEIARDALITLERPYVFVEEIKPLIQNNIGNRAGAPSFPAVRIKLKNYGRAPAIIKELNAELGLWQVAQEPVLRRQPLPHPIVLGAGAEYGPIEISHQTYIGDGVASQVRQGSFHFWFHSTIQYEEMNSQKHSTTARLRYEFSQNIFVASENDSYNKST
jgi:hypothetical protein